MLNLPMMSYGLTLAGALVLSACASGPKPPDWQIEAKGAMERSVAAYLEGNSRVEGAELARARSQLARTGRADLLATAELLHCASRVASLVFEPCAGFAPLRPDALEAQRAYADYLSGQISPAQIALLPEAQRAAAAAAGNANALVGIADPLARCCKAAKPARLRLRRQLAPPRPRAGAVRCWLGSACSCSAPNRRATRCKPSSCAGA